MFFYYVNCFKNYFNFRGRSNRAETWSFIGLNFILYVSFFTCSLFFLNKDPELYKSEAFSISFYLFFILTFIPGLSVRIRRLHDLNKNWKWWLLNFVPLGSLYLIYLYLKKGDSHKNKFGEKLILDKKNNKASLFFYLGFIFLLFGIYFISYFAIKKPDGIFNVLEGDVLDYCEGMATYKNGFKNGPAEYTCHSVTMGEYYKKVEFKNSTKIQSITIYKNQIDIYEAEIPDCEYSIKTYQLPEKYLSEERRVNVCKNHNHYKTDRYYDEIGNLTGIKDYITGDETSYYHDKQKKESLPLRISKECSQNKTLCKEFYRSGGLKRIIDYTNNKMEEFSEDNKLVASFILGDSSYSKKGLILVSNLTNRGLKEGFSFDKEGNKRQLNQAELLAHENDFVVKLKTVDKIKRAGVNIINCK